MKKTIVSIVLILIALSCFIYYKYQKQKASHAVIVKLQYDAWKETEVHKRVVERMKESTDMDSLRAVVSLEVQADSAIQFHE